MKDKAKLKRRKNIKLGLYIFMLVDLSILITVLNRAGIGTLEFGGKPVSVSSFSGVVTVFMMIVSMLILNVDNKKGFIATLIVNGYQLLSVSMSVFLMGKMEAITGVPMTMGIIGVLFLQHNYINKIQHNEQHLHMLSVTDPLTGLKNRRGTMNYVNDMIDSEQPFALLFFDLDNFKNINDTKGHDIGDVVLCEIAKRWTSIADENVYIGRTGGDEFAMIVSGRSDDELRTFAEKCLSVLTDVIHTEKCDYYASCSAGVAKYPQDGKDCDSLFRFADTAMYKAKSSGKSRVCFFDAEMLSEIHGEMKLETEIRNALEYNRFYLVFQPQFETGTKRLRGFESLLRLKDSDGKPIPPSVFIPVAEKSGLILDIDRWVLRHAMQSFAEYAAINSEFVVSVNISARHITDRGLAGEIKDILDETGFPPHMLEVEVTESFFISSVDEAIETLLQIKKLGVKIALDDFGTGYASLSYLQRLPIDLLKIDKSFIDDMTERDESGNFVNAIISIGHMFNCKVISEGVELESQLDKLRELNCDYIQGYIWGKPQERSSAVQFIE